MPAIDERVIWYRRIAAAEDEATVAALATQIEGSYGAMPAPARNLIDRMRLRFLAEACGINHIAHIRGKLNFEPLVLNNAQCEWAKQNKATYFVQSHRLLAAVPEGMGMLSYALSILETLSGSFEA